MCKKSILFLSVLLFYGNFNTLADEFKFTVGDQWTYRYDSLEFTNKVFSYDQEVGGYRVVRHLNLQDSYGGGSYHADIPRIGYCEIGTDVHDALTGSYQGISINSPPIPFMGALKFGDPAGTVKEWIGYQPLHQFVKLNCQTALLTESMLSRPFMEMETLFLLDNSRAAFK